MSVRSLLLAGVTAALALAGCGSTTTPASHSPRPATLILDYTPNAIHTGIYAAVANGYDRAAGVQLQVIAPSSSSNAVSLLTAGRVDFAILDIHDLALARAKGAGIVGVMPIVQRPLASVIAGAGITRPRQLEGRTVGVTGAPSDGAVLDSIVAGDGGSPREIHQQTIGYGAVPYLLGGRVAGATAFWNDEGVTLSHQRPGRFHVFEVQQFGAPSYPELVVCASTRTLARAPELAREVVHALRRGYQFTVARPDAAARKLERLVPGLNDKLVAEQLAVELPAFRGADGQVGRFDPAVLSAWSKWEAKFGIVRHPPDVASTFDTAF